MSDVLIVLKPVTLYHRDWSFALVAPKGRRLTVIDRVSDERGSCIIVQTAGVEYVINCDELSPGQLTDG